MIFLKRSFSFKIAACTLLLLLFLFIKTSFNRYYLNIAQDLPTDIMVVNQSLDLVDKRFSEKEIVVAAVACGDRLDDTLTMLKSCIMFSRGNPIKFIIMADDDLMLDFEEKLTSWKEIIGDKLRFTILPLKFPEKNADEWRKLFKPCAAQRLFLPSLLPEIDALIYLDTDTLFLSPVEDLWKHFYDFNTTQMAALALENEDPLISWYSRFAKHPYYGKLGVNSGVMLMNLTRMRSFHWENYVSSVYNHWKTQLTWGDQDIINIIFHYHSEDLFLLDCTENYRPDQCQYGLLCKNAPHLGVKVMHGSRNAFHNLNQPVFGTIHKIMKNYQIGTDPSRYYLEPLLNEFETLRNSENNCAKNIKIYTKIAKQLWEKPYDK